MLILDQYVVFVYDLRTSSRPVTCWKLPLSVVCATISALAYDRDKQSIFVNDLISDTSLHLLILLNVSYPLSSTTARLVGGVLQ